MSNYFKSIAIPIILLCFSNTISAQTTDKTIKIVGNSKGTYQSEGIMVYFTLTEIQPNEYRQVRYKPIETIYQNFVATLTKIGIKETELSRDLRTPTPQYQAVKSEKYVLRIAESEKAEQFMKAEMEGVSITEIKYIFKNPGVEAEEKLAIDAIRDAERKAQKLAKEIGKKIGKVVSIEDKSSGCCREIEDGRDKSVSKIYKISVTFELLD